MERMSPWVSSEVVEGYSRWLQPTYGRLPVVFVRGSGARLWDAEGKCYLDWTSGGRAGNALGHCHPAVTAALERQLRTLTYVSNDFHHPWAAELGRMLAERSGGRRSFFCNSGAEATETAIKLARKWGKAKRGPECTEIVTFTGSFHGRTCGALSATGQTKFHQGFEPLMPGFRYVDWGDIEGLSHAVGRQTCAVMLEPVQGESGIHPAAPEFLGAVEALCRRHEALLILDEVQTGFGRTGKFWAYEHYGADPDVVTLAKSLGAGFAVAACLAKPECCVLTAGDHGCTFGGHPFAAAAGVAGLQALDAENGLQNAAELGGYLRQQLGQWPSIGAVRGLGLMIGIDVRAGNAMRVVQEALQHGLIIHAVGDTILRLLPPVILSRSEADEGLELLQRAIRAAAG